MTGSTLDLVQMASDAVGVCLFEPTLIRYGENVIWKINASTVARIGRKGQVEAARREVNIANWLAEHDFPAVRLIPGLAQPIEMSGRPVTFWQALPSHRQGTVKHVAHLLRRLHDLPQPTSFDPGQLQPFVRLQERIDEASMIEPDDRTWLSNHLAELEERWTALPPGKPSCVIHGDAWVGNVAITEARHALLLDLERAAIGPPEWDLVSTAIKVSSFGWVSSEEYQEFVEIYGTDVMSWSGFEVLRDIRELRMATYLLQKSGGNNGLVSEARFRVECLRGRRGERPWRWTPSS